ncbi:g12019 [Coccomyxa viridis]|uniref:G12019 protein n=1 Tax=Coccomyxa viridis TaxID=1274662 RepID=A0ABP1GEY3_9CHLO
MNIEAEKRSVAVSNAANRETDTRHENAGRCNRACTSLAATLLLSQVSCHASLAEEAVTKYVPGPVEVGPQIWVGAIAATIPFVIGSWEFAKRIIIQRRCQKCGGNGLVMKGRFARKCPECGGFFPWQGWKRFFTSTALPGNGGPLRQPRGQTSIFYKVPEDPRKANVAQGSLPGREAQQDAGQKDEAGVER